MSGLKKNTSQARQKKEKNVSPAANQSWRDRLEKTKLNQQRTSRAGATGKNSGSNTSNQFQNTTPGNTSRKIRKGMRPG